MTTQVQQFKINFQTSDYQTNKFNYFLHFTSYILQNLGNPLAFPNATARVGLSATIFFVEDDFTFD